MDEPWIPSGFLHDAVRILEHFDEDSEGTPTARSKALADGIDEAGGVRHPSHPYHQPHWPHSSHLPFQQHRARLMGWMGLARSGGTDGMDEIAGDGVDEVHHQSHQPC